MFYWKMAGDYYRYLAEFAASADKEERALKAQERYEEATKSGQSLPATNPIRLGLALNFSVFYYEILNKPERACELAKSAFDDAISELDRLPVRVVSHGFVARRCPASASALLGIEASPAAPFSLAPATCRRRSTRTPH